MKKEKCCSTRLTAVFLALLIIFIAIITYFVIPSSVAIKRAMFPILAVLALIFFLLGIALIVFTVKEKVKGRLKKFLILTGACSTGFLVSIILHNLIYGLFIVLFGADFWTRIGLGDEPLFFIIAIIICPIGFLVGVIGSIVLFIKKK